MDRARTGHGAGGTDGAYDDTSATGLPGVAVGFDPNKVTYVTGPASVIAPGQTLVVSALCTAGSKVVSGGYFASINDVAASAPDIYGGTQWDIIVQNKTSIYVTSWAYAVCVAP